MAETIAGKGIKVAIGCDHAGYALKEELKKFYQQEGFKVTDFGTNSSESVDYPDYVHPLCNSVEVKENDFGVIVCGSGNGVAMTANKHSGIRAALCWNREIASLARRHNDANVLSLPARFIDTETAREISLTFLNEKFDGGRHQLRVKKIAEC